LEIDETKKRKKRKNRKRGSKEELEAVAKAVVVKKSNHNIY